MKHYDSQFLERTIDGMVVDYEPDLFHYSFLGHVGEMYDKPAIGGGITRNMNPHFSFKMEETNNGYRIIDDKGLIYLFETREQNGLQTTSWFLTSITSPEGGGAFFHYTNITLNDVDSDVQSQWISKKLTRIDYDYGYVVFGANIALYNNNNIIVKEYELGYTSFSNTGNNPDYRLGLKSIKEIGAENRKKPAYEFEYDYLFSLPRSSAQNIPFPLSRKSKAQTPLTLVSVNRNLLGHPIPEINYYGNPNNPEYYMYDITGISYYSDPVAITIDDYFCLSKVKFPSGGEELYSYERHNFISVGSQADTLSMNMGNGRTLVSGKRLKRKEIFEGEKLINSIEYVYKRGVLTNPSIHTTTKYTPQYEMINNNIKLIASTYNTMDPQNSGGSVPVYYGIVEECFFSSSGLSNGKKIYYYGGMSGLLPNNYIILNNSSSNLNSLINIPNTLGGTQTFYSTNPIISAYSNSYGAYLSYPIKRISENDYAKGNLVKEETYNKDGVKIRQVEHIYNYNFSDQQYGYSIDKYNDNNLVPNSYSGVLTRYVISVMPISRGILQPQKSIITDFYESGTVVREENFSYNNKNLLNAVTILDSKGEYQSSETHYVGDISQATNTNLDINATAIQTMKNKNMVGIPVQKTFRRGNYYANGSYTSFRQLNNGKVVIDSTFFLESNSITSVSAPFINASGRIQRNSAFVGDKSFPYYDQYANPLTIVSKNGLSETIVKGHDGYVVAIFNNYSYAQLENNSALLFQLNLLKEYKVIDDNNWISLRNVNNAIRQSLPAGVFVTTYTYDANVGQTSSCDSRGQSVYFNYDSLKRLSTIRDNEWNINKQYCYNYAGQIQDCNGVVTITEPPIIYVKREFLNPQKIVSVGYEIDIADVRYSLYADSTCSQPYATTQELIVSNSISYSYFYTGGNSYTTDPSGFTITFSIGTHEKIFTQNEIVISFENGFDPILGQLYEVIFTNFILLPGAGYQVVP